MKIFHYLLLLIFFFVTPSVLAQDYTLASPDGRISLEVHAAEKITWNVSLEKVPVIAPSTLSLEVNDEILGQKPKVRTDKRREVRENIKPVVPLKSKNVKNNYNELLLTFRGNYAIAFRVYNDGVAYRFQTSFKKDITVNRENMEVHFPAGYTIYFPEEDSYISHYERSYTDTLLPAITKAQFCSLPTLLTSRKGINVLVTEADLFDYPNMFMYGTGGNALTAEFPKAVLETTPNPKRPDRSEKITKKAEYIALTDGTRNFPWRVFTITEDDGALVESNLVFKLSSPPKLENTSWIRPGKVAWDWYNANNIYGVDFRAGLNTETYKYYIDFAAAHNLPYIILDEGWSKSTTDLSAPNPGLDLMELIRYGKSKKVGIILWMLWQPLNQNMESLLDKFAGWGVKGIKVDFMQRADQEMVNFYDRLARESGERKLLVDLHGAYKPTGLHRTYPNVLTFEGLKGSENNKWSNDITPDHNLTLPFIRMVAGPMDYTPGVMVNANKESFHDIFDTPMSMGTRCHQLAMYIIYESPLQMLADSPTNYYREPESTRFIAQIPVTWDETHVFEAKVSDYILMARKKGDKWYVGAMTDWTPREFTLDCSFLGEGNYQIAIMKDGINADRNANDYKQVTKTITSESVLQLDLAPGGGWAAIIEKE